MKVYAVYYDSGDWDDREVMLSLFSTIDNATHYIINRIKTDLDQTQKLCPTWTGRKSAEKRQLKRYEVREMPVL